MAVALGYLVPAFELLVVCVLNPERLPDIVDAILIGRRVVSARSFVAHGIGVLPFGIDVTGGEHGPTFGVTIELSPKLVVARAG
jgi:hypothetical protein